MKNKIDIDNVVNVMSTFSSYLKLIRKSADKAKMYSCDRKIEDLETFSRTLKTIEDTINSNKKIITMLPLISYDADIDSNNAIYVLMKEVMNNGR